MHVEAEHESANDAVYWYAVSSRSRHEKIVATALTNTGVTTFLPLVSEMHSWRDRRKLVVVPLFPGYVFVQIPNTPRSQAACTQNKRRCPVCGKPPGAMPIPDKEISDVRAVLEHKVSCSPHPFLRLGQRVRIRGGSMDGVEGILVGCDSPFETRDFDRADSTLPCRERLQP